MGTVAHNDRQVQAAGQDIAGTAGIIERVVVWRVSGDPGSVDERPTAATGQWIDLGSYGDGTTFAWRQVFHLPGGTGAAGGCDARATAGRAKVGQYGWDCVGDEDAGSGYRAVVDIDQTVGQPVAESQRTRLA